MPSANTEDLRRKFLVVQQQRSAPPNLAGDTLPSAIPNAGATSATTSLMMTTSTGLGGVGAMGAGEPERTYVFPGGNPAVGSAPGGGQGIPGVAMANPSRGHARSISHGGGAIVGANGRPIKSAMKGHQRAFSQGQITDSPPGSAAPAGRGHSRVGSKTDFILPPGHKEEATREPSAPTSAVGGRGHSRQASRSESIYTLRRTEAPPWWKRLSLCNYNTSDKFEERSYRMVVPNHTVPPKTPKRDHPNGQFVGNKIRTTKYTLLSFIPKNLLEQFHRVANLYFIFIVLLNWVPEISAFGKEVAMIPVLFVLGVTAVKDLFEDRRRRASDKRINNTTCRVYDG
ncbi:hypothetical protein M5D96_003253 [Drosophila gunungcola]|uniref:P-type ATPase N-terminal domain-containing protein n=2 Tax=Drosophila gunungcola TaxID=103775 RepID=A0A9Q0BRE7_9MUSC|nr:hypothetical protein M5D96_003253 [Drosophila gunungcola]